MNHHDDLFQPESVNEQVEDLMHIQDVRQQQATPGAPTIATLRAIYAEDTAILERAWSRIARAEYEARRQFSEPNTLSMEQIQSLGEKPMQEIDTPTRENKPNSHPVAITTKRPRSHQPLRVWALVGLAAAILFVLANMVAFRYFEQGHHSPASTTHTEIGTTFYTHTFPQKSKNGDDDISISMLQWSPDGKRLAVAAGPMRHGSVHVWDALTGSHEVVLTPEQSKNQYVDSEVYATQISWSPDGTRLASAIGDVQVWDPATKKLLARYFPVVHNTATVNQVAWSPDGQYLAGGYNASDGTGGVTIWNTRTRTVAKTLSSGQIDAISWSPNGKYLAIANDNKTVIRNTADWQPVLTLNGQAVTWSPDSTRLALPKHLTKPSVDTVQIVNIPTGKIALTYQSQEYSHAISWSSDGKRIVSAGDKTIQIWDSRTGEKLFTYTGQYGTKDGNTSLGSLSWSPDGKYIASCADFASQSGGGGTIKVWQAE